MSALDDFKSLLRTFLAGGQVFLFNRGRVAFYALLRALDLKPGEEVILPNFTCVAVANAIHYAGATPVYCDIDPHTYTLTAAAVERKITPRTRVILAQNTFGLSSDLDPLLALARHYRLQVIEDCAHGLGGQYKGQPNGTVADAAFFSLQWSKPISTGLGGIAVTSVPEIAEKLAVAEKAYLAPRLFESLSLRLLVAGYDRFFSPRFFWRAQHAYRRLSQWGVVPGSSTWGEVNGVVKPRNFEKRYPAILARRGNHALQHLVQTIAHRQRVADAYDEILRQIDRVTPVQPAYAIHAFLRYPLEVRNRSGFLAEAQKRYIEVGDWFRSPLHPVEGDLRPWGYQWGCGPVGENVSRHIVNLPTHRHVSPNEIGRIGDFLMDMKKRDIV